MTYIYSPAKNRRSGTTLQRHTHPTTEARKLEARKVLAGFPINRPFQSRKEVEEYLSGDRIVCLLCGKPYKMLAPHIKRIHGTDAEDYKSIYGIPQKYGLTCEEATEVRRNNLSPEKAKILSTSRDVKFLPPKGAKIKNKHPDWLWKEKSEKMLAKSKVDKEPME